MPRPRKNLFRFDSLLLAISIVISIVLWSDAEALAKVGALDRTFGIRGRAVKALNFGDPKYWYSVKVRMAGTPDGGIVVAGNNLMLDFLPSGRLDKNFAENGILRLKIFAGQPFELNDLAIDSKGRIVVAGVASYDHRAVIFRFEPNGTPDLSFGGGDGVVMTDFELPPPEHVFPQDNPTETDVSVTGVAVDPEDRIVVSGAAIEYYGYCLRVTEGYVARLRPEGGLDSTFGSNGAVTYAAATSESADNLLLDTVGNPLFSGTGYSCRQWPGASGSAVYRLSLDGSPDNSFGQTGQISTATPLQMVLDSSERIVMLTYEDTIVRFLSSGALDPGFGNHGMVHIRGTWIPGGIAVTQRGGVLITGTGKGHYRGPKHKSRQRLVLTRLGPRGGLDRNFGNSGIAKAQLDHGSSTSGRQVLVDDGHATVAAAAWSPSLSTRQGVALFRFDLGQ